MQYPTFLPILLRILTQDIFWNKSLKNQFIFLTHYQLLEIALTLKKAFFG